MSLEETNMDLMQNIPPTGKRFEVDFCTVARWHDGQIVEETAS